MAGKVQIEGVSYDIKTGKVQIDGVTYDITKGKTQIDGVAYDIKFGAEPFVIFQLGDTALQNGATFAARTNISIKAASGIRLNPPEEDTVAGFAIEIDFTPYSTLHIGYNMASYPTVDSYNRKVGYSKNKLLRKIDFDSAQSLARGSSGEATFDISDISGTKFIKALSDDYTSTYNYITSIYLD